MRAFRLFLRITLYYSCAALFIFLLLLVYPDAKSYFPVGGAQAILQSSNNDPFTAIEMPVEEVSDLGKSMLWVIIAVLSSLLISIPVCTTYIACRKRNEYDNSIVRSILILPMLLTSIVLIVHDSLALAFLMAIGIGLSAGIGAIEVALVTTVIVNYCYVFLWVTEFGVIKGSTRYMRRPYGKHDVIDADEQEAKRI